MLIVPNSQVLVLGGHLKKDVVVTIEVFSSWQKIGAAVNMLTKDGKTELVEGLYDDSFEIPPHMLTSKIDFLPTLGKMKEGMSKGKDSYQVFVEEALRNCLRILRIDISVPGKIVFQLSLRIRGDLRYMMEYPEIYKEEGYANLFEFRK